VRCAEAFPEVVEWTRYGRPYVAPPSLASVAR